MMTRIRAVRVLPLLLLATAAVAQDRSGTTPQTAKEPAEDLIGRPVDLDLSRGVQAPYRDPSKLPATFVEAAKTQPVDPRWGTRPYHPQSRRDLSGIWINQGGIGWTPGIPPGAGQNPPLTPAYARVFAQHLADAREGKPTGDPTAACLHKGCPGS